MALLVKKKKSFILPHETHLKMCLTKQHIVNMAAVQVSWPIPMRAIGAQNLLTMPGGVTIAGYLHKKGGSQFSLMKWPLRYIIIHKGCVYYFKTSSSTTPQGAFSLNGYNRVMRAAEETTSSNVFPFKIVHFSKKHRTWYFSAASEDERRKWMHHLRKEINYYNDEKDFLVLSESDSDAESFYGQIESPLDITDAPDHPEAEYRLQDEDSDEEDYLLPDGPGQPTVPPPNYPPPPVPSQDRDHFPSISLKGTPPPVPPPPSKPPPCPASLKKPPPASCPPVHLEIVPKGPPPPLPMSTHSKCHLNRSAGGLANHTPPATPPICLNRPAMPTATLPTYDRKPSPSVVIESPSTLPICQGLNDVVLKNGGGSNAHNHTIPGTKSSEERKPTRPIPGGHKPLLVPKPPLPITKPKSRPSLQRSSPDGQSFRTSVEENPLNTKVHVENSDDDDYENVQLPDSVFVDTTETHAVEKLFKETLSSPQDGLYCIRNSGTKTSKVLVVWDVSLNKARNYRLFEENSKFFLDSEIPPFSSLAALVEYYYTHPLPNHGSLCLQRPYGYTPPR